MVIDHHYPYEKDRTENIQKTYKKCAPYGNCTEIVQKIYRKCAKICNNSNNEPVSTNELLQNLAHFLHIFCTISVQFPYGAHFLYVFCMIIFHRDPNKFSCRKAEKHLVCFVSGQLTKKLKEYATFDFISVL